MAKSYRDSVYLEAAELLDAEDPGTRQYSCCTIRALASKYGGSVAALQALYDDRVLCGQGATSIYDAAVLGTVFAAGDTPDVVEGWIRARERQHRVFLLLFAHFMELDLEP